MKCITTLCEPEWYQEDINKQTTKTMENKRNHKEKSIRELAIENWHKLTLEEKFYKVIAWLKSKGLNTTDRHPNSLTGREIEEIWRKECEQIEDEVFKPNQREYNPERKKQDLLLALLYNIVNNKNVQEWFNWDSIRAAEGFNFSKEKTISDYDKIWKEEIEKCKFIPIIIENKPNQKQIADEIIDLVGENQFKEIIKESERRVNQKQFKEGNDNLFKAYINKFSQEYKTRMLQILIDDLGVRALVDESLCSK